MQELLPVKIANMLLDAAATREIHRQKCQDMLTTLLGTNLAEDFPEHIITQFKKMLISHLILLIQTICTISTPDEYTQINQENVELATTDLKKGKIVVRAEDIKGRLHHRNIRNMLDKLSFPEMPYYDIGVWSASTRTRTQQKLANNYTKVIVKQAYDNIIFVDGSMNVKDDPGCNKCSKSGYGGCGGILTSKDMDTQTPCTYFRKKVDTNDPQLAELQGILTALQLAEQTHVETD